MKPRSSRPSGEETPGQPSARRWRHARKEPSADRKVAGRSADKLPAARSAADRLRRVRDGVRGQLSMARAVERGEVEWIDDAGEPVPPFPAGAGQIPGPTLPAESPVSLTQQDGPEPAPQAPSQPSQPAGGALPRFTVAILTIGAAWLAFSLLHELSSVIAPMFFALNMMITAYPIHAVLVRHRCPRGIAATVTGLVVVVMLAGFLAGIAWSVAAMITQMQKYVSQMERLYRSTIELLTRVGWDEAVILDKLKKIDPQQVVSVASSLLSDTTSVVTMLVVIVTGMIFMVMDTSQIGDRLRAAGRQKPGVAAALEGFASGIRRYWLVTTIFGIIVALLDWAVLLGLGVPLAAVWALFSFLTNYVPNIGFIIGVIPPAMLALFDQGWVSAVIVIAAYSVLNFVVQSIIQPKFTGDAVGLTPTMSFVSLLLWGWVFGALGPLIALPCSLLVKALLIDPDPDSRWVNALISSRPADPRDPSGGSPAG